MFAVRPLLASLFLTVLAIGGYRAHQPGEFVRACGDRFGFDYASAHSPVMRAQLRCGSVC